MRDRKDKLRSPLASIFPCEWRGRTKGLLQESRCLRALERKGLLCANFRWRRFFSISQQCCPLLLLYPGGSVPPRCPSLLSGCTALASPCHISYWIGCLIKIIIKIDLLISMHLLCLSHLCVPLSTEDVRTDRREPDPRPAPPDGVD